MKRTVKLIILISFCVCIIAACLMVSASNETPKAKVYSANVSLDDCLNLRFTTLYDSIDAVKDEYGLIIWFAKQEVGKYTIENARKAQKEGQAVIKNGGAKFDASLGKYSAVYTYGIAAKQMADMYYVQAYSIIDGVISYSEVVPYSVTTYAARKLGLVSGVEGTSDEELKTLIKEMIEYGAAAQKYFHYNESNLATDILKKTASFTVKFVDYDGAELKTETVEDGGAATPPANPTREGYVFSGWDKAFNYIKEDLVVTAQYQEITEPTLIVEKVTASAGETVTVRVLVKNNPGIAGAKIKLAYDSALTLSSAASGEAFSMLDYTQPPFKNPCYFNWDSLDQESHENGTILTLTFKVPSNITSGKVLNLNCSYSAGDIYDVNLNDVSLTMVSGSITVK